MNADIAPYDVWFCNVKAALDSINMPMDTWQASAAFDFLHEFETGVSAGDAASKANRFWWRKQNERVNQHCVVTDGCWLPRNHQGECKPL